MDGEGLNFIEIQALFAVVDPPFLVEILSAVKVTSYCCDTSRHRGSFVETSFGL